MMDCNRIVRSCEGCIVEKYVWGKQLELLPTDKPRAPFEGWSIDLITNLEPPCQGFKHCLVAIDCFSKWVEIVPIVDRTS